MAACLYIYVGCYDLYEIQLWILAVGFQLLNQYRLCLAIEFLPFG